MCIAGIRHCGGRSGKWKIIARRKKRLSDIASEHSSVYTLLLRNTYTGCFVLWYVGRWNTAHGKLIWLNLVLMFSFCCLKLVLIADTSARRWHWLAGLLVCVYLVPVIVCLLVLLVGWWMLGLAYGSHWDVYPIPFLFVWCLACLAVTG